MKPNKSIVERTMNSLDDIRAINAPLGFEQRLFEKIQKQNQWQKYFKYALAALVIFCIINVFTALQIANDSTQDSYLDEAYFADSTSPILNFTDNE